MADGVLEGKAALVTGARRGIGRAIAEALAAAGADVAVNVRPGSDDGAAEVQGVIEALGRKCVVLPGDVANSAAAAALVEHTVAAFGRLDILVNNAAITRDNLLLRMSDDDWNAVLAVNLTGAFYCLRAAAKVMLKQRAGKIVNLSSVVGVHGNPGQANYVATKAGLIGLTKSAAQELAARNIQVNAVAPGLIATEMTAAMTPQARERLAGLIPAGREGAPEDVARVVVFLCSPAADYLTGQVVNVDGGLLM